MKQSDTKKFCRGAEWIRKTETEDFTLLSQMSSKKP